MKRVNKGKLIALFITSILPILAIVLGCRMLSRGWMLNAALAITHFIIPAIAIILLTVVIMSRKRVFFKILLTILILVCFVFSFMFASLFTFEKIYRYEDEQIGDAYAEVVNRFQTMPTLEELGNYSKILHYDFYGEGFLIFSWDADTIIVYYSDEEYEKQKVMLDEKYVFENEETASIYNSEEPTVSIDGYVFRTLDTDGTYRWELEYPKKIMFIATNDEEKAICYIAYEDMDLDYIDSLESFLLQDCGWKYILKELE